jgi:protein-L-isoaspartate(D-aspartate) O-methyltransferase
VPGRRLAVLVAAAALAACGGSAAQPTEERQRQAMVARIEQLAAAGALAGPRRLDRRVAAVMREIPRHRFVPQDVRNLAYEDTALPIGHQSTISQPFMVATMTDLLDVEPGQKVLEVGTGSGYQAAILSRLGAKVFTIEIVEPLARAADARLKAMGYGGVSVRAGDGYKGWPDAAPFDSIMVTAGATHVPQPLVDQLKRGGRMLIPMGESAQRQQLTLVTKDAAGKVAVRRLGQVMFIPLDERARPTP